MAEWRVGAARNLPINDKSSWDASAARQRIFARPQSQWKRAFLVYDAEIADQHGAYKLPFADIIDGKLTAVAGGLRAAAGRLPQTDVPTEVKNRARAVLDGYFERMNKSDKVTLRYKDAGTVRVKAEAGEDEWKLEVLGIPYGGHLYGRDSEGETFTEDTDLWLAEGERRPAAYYHGMKPDGVPEDHPRPIGVAEFVRRDEQGGWFEVTLDKASEWAARVWQAAQEGAAKASSGAIGHLVRVDWGGVIGVWPVAELSIFDVGERRRPANELAVAVPLKALYDAAKLEMPQAFTQAGEAEVDAVQDGDGSDGFEQLRLRARAWLLLAEKE